MSKTTVLGILLVLVIVLTASYIYLSDNETAVEIEAVNYTSGIMLEDKEFSSIVLYDEMIYAGGTHGLYQIDPKDFTYSEVKKNEENYISVRALLRDGDDLLVGHEEGIDIYSHGNTDKEPVLTRSIGLTDGLIDPRIHDMLRVDDQTLYASTFSGVAVIKEGNIEYITMKDFLPGDIIKVMLKDDYGGVWFGSYVSKGGGVVCVTNGNIQRFDISTGLVHDAITTIAKDDKGRIYIGSGVYTKGGANILERIEGKWEITRTLLSEDGLAGDKVRFIFPEKGRIWYCSEFDGIAILYDNMQTAIITTRNGLSDNEVKRIITDDTGNYWLATNRGITLIHKDDLNNLGGVEY